VKPGGDTSRLTILFVTSMHPSAAFPQRGVIVLRQAEALRALGHRVEFVELGDTGRPTRYYFARRRVREAIRVVAPDVVHAHFGYSGIAIPRTSVPTVCTFNGDDLNGTAKRSGGITWKSRVGILISQYVAWRSTRCIAVSSPLRNRLWLRGLRAKTVVIRDAVDQHLFYPRSRTAARAKLGLSLDEVLIIFPHDAAVETKRLWLAEAAVRHLRQELPAARLWVVNGKTPDEMPWYYAAADLMIVTSEREGGPSSVKEALACGCPVVSVAVGDTDLFEEVSGDGMVRADDRPEDLSAALRRALTSTEVSGDRISLLPRGLTLNEAARALEQVYLQVTSPTSET
jgi:glycosyltransferase involved in cell wall biosynthesis